MKKLSLKNLKLDANDMLQRNQLKTVFGGYGGYGGFGVKCTAECNATCSVTCSTDNGTCAAVDGQNGYCKVDDEIKKFCSREC